MQIVKDITETQLAEIIRSVSDAFYDYEYDPDDGGLRVSPWLKKTRHFSASLNF